MDWKLIGSIILGGITFLNHKNQKELSENYAEAIGDLRSAQNDTFPTYTDAALALAEERLKDFMVAYSNLLQQEVALRKEQADV